MSLFDEIRYLIALAFVVVYERIAGVSRWRVNGTGASRWRKMDDEDGLEFTP